MGCCKHHWQVLGGGARQEMYSDSSATDGRVICMNTRTVGPSEAPTPQMRPEIHASPSLSNPAAKSLQPCSKPSLQSGTHGESPKTLAPQAGGQPICIESRGALAAGRDGGASKPLARVNLRIQRMCKPQISQQENSRLCHSVFSELFGKFKADI